MGSNGDLPLAIRRKCGLRDEYAGAHKPSLHRLNGGAVLRRYRQLDPGVLEEWFVQRILHMHLEGNLYVGLQLGRRFERDFEVPLRVRQQNQPRQTKQY